MIIGKSLLIKIPSSSKIS